MNNFVMYPEYFPTSSYPSLSGSFLFLPSVPIACDASLGNVDKRFPLFVSCQVVVTAYRIFDLLFFLTLGITRSTAHYCSALRTFSYSSSVPPAWISFLLALSSSHCDLASSFGIFFAVGAPVARPTHTVLRVPSFSIVVVIGVPSITRYRPVLADSTFLYYSFARRSVADVCIGGQSRYTKCPTSILFAVLRICLL